MTSNPAFTERNIQKPNAYLLNSRLEQKYLVTYHTLPSFYVCVWLVNTLTSTAPIGSPINRMWSPADVCEQWERNLSFSSADVRWAGTRDEPLRTSAWEANWLRTRKLSQLLQAGKYSSFWLFSPWSPVGHALHPIFMLRLVKIWQVSSCGKFMQHLETCLLWQLKLTAFCVNKWNSAAIKSLLLFVASLFNGFLVEKDVKVNCQSYKAFKKNCLKGSGIIFMIIIIYFYNYYYCY